MRDIDTTLHIEGLEIPIKVPASRTPVPNAKHHHMYPNMPARINLSCTYNRKLKEVEEENFNKFMSNQLHLLIKNFIERDKKGWE